MTQTKWLEQKERGTTMGMRILLWTCNYLGIHVAVALLGPVVLYFYLTGTAARQASLDYLRRLNRWHPPAHRPPTFVDGYRHFMAFARTALDKFWMWQERFSRYDMDLNDEAILTTYHAMGKGCLVIGAHVGNMDMLRILSLKRHITVNAVMHLDNAKGFNRLLNAVTPDVKLNLINLKDRNIDAVLDLKARVDRGEIVAILGDRHYPASKIRDIPCPFLGETANFPANPWIMAHLLECPVVMAAGVRQSRRKYRLMVAPVGEKVVLNRKDRERKLHRLVTGYAAFLESICIAHPYQWFNFYDFWSRNENK